jgi:EAL domain-containing protein (putative c-di-GMP-specific phosphodiesterase class I)
MIVRAIISLGKGLGMRTTAEGIETIEQLEQIRSEGCNEAQGYYLSGPVPVTALASVIMKWSRGLKKASHLKSVQQN